MNTPWLYSECRWSDIQAWDLSSNHTTRERVRPSATHCVTALMTHSLSVVSRYKNVTCVHFFNLHFRSSGRKYPSVLVYTVCESVMFRYLLKYAQKCSGERLRLQTWFLHTLFTCSVCVCVLLWWFVNLFTQFFPLQLIYFHMILHDTFIFPHVHPAFFYTIHWFTDSFSHPILFHMIPLF